MNKEELLNFVNKQNPFFNNNHMRITEVTETEAFGELDVVPSVCNPFGNVHGGAYYTLADTTVGVLSRVDGKRNVTLEGGLNFLKGTNKGKVYSHAITVHKGRTTGVYNVTLYNDEKVPVATGIFTMYFVNVEI